MDSASFVALLEHTLISALITLAFFIVGILLSRKILPAIDKHLDPEKHDVLSILLKGFRGPLNLYLKIAGTCCGLLVFGKWQPGTIPTFLSQIDTVLPPILYKILRISAIFVVAWGLLASSDISALLLRRVRHKLDLHVGKSVTRFLAAIYKVIVVAVAIVLFFDEMNYNLTGLITGLGLGGLTIALAAQDTASNFFGGIVLIVEKPFEIGDWISTPEVEGIVENISLRSTIIRTEPGILTTVPNAGLSVANITNWRDGMVRRCVKMTLGLNYDTTRQQLKDYTAALRKLLESDTEIVPDSVSVRFSNLGESTLDVSVSFDTQLRSSAEHNRIKERVNYAVLEYAENLGIEFAFPTRTLYMKSDDAGEEKQPAHLLPPAAGPAKQPPAVQGITDQSSF